MNAKSNTRLQERVIYLAFGEFVIDRSPAESVEYPWVENLI